MTIYLDKIDNLKINNLGNLIYYKIPEDEYTVAEICLALSKVIFLVTRNSINDSEV